MEYYVQKLIPVNGLNKVETALSELLCSVISGGTDAEVREKGIDLYNVVSVFIEKMNKVNS